MGLTMLAGMLAMAGILAAANYLATGDPWTAPFSRYYHEHLRGRGR